MSEDESPPQEVIDIINKITVGAEKEHTPHPMPEVVQARFRVEPLLGVKVFLFSFSISSSQKRISPLCSATKTKTSPSLYVGYSYGTRS